MSVQTQSATITAGRRLLSADPDRAVKKQEVQYVTRGNHLLATRPGKVLGDELTEVRFWHLADGTSFCATPGLRSTGHRTEILARSSA